MCQLVRFVCMGTGEFEVLRFLALDAEGVGPPEHLNKSMIQFDLEQPIVVGDQTYKTVYVSSVPFNCRLHARHFRVPCMHIS